ncbi:helicase-related protein, partial [Clostridioides difficile]|uniref:helicase-related protein n=1 Tax=Clostridioides difficile TaxID=1496 RepID=UPI003F8D4F5F
MFITSIYICFYKLLIFLEYHAGLSKNERSKNQEDFINDNVDIMVATNAFGMGIDKPNIR